ncbi:MAG: U32 family peptidase [Clostridia bacterium]|nr:U32 family peptidase [Clostridia bacterium]
MNNFHEILAPAGSPDSLKAAVLCGADAVYLGVKELNARRGADNFDYSDLEQSVKFCHARGVKVYLTLNTVINDGEIKTASKIIERACASGIDALILQDLAAAQIAKRCAPDMPIHASTQMSVQALDGICKLAELGFSRAVLPREMSKSEIEFLCKHSPIELEMFIHGALCMCVSGQCYMSAVLGSRSGNRGACAQPCRLPFSAKGTGRFDLSLKDLSLTDYIKELCDMGIASFKIEGRMKRPEYVAAAVTACKQAVSGTVDPEIKQDLQSIFSRTGFTDGYYQNTLGKEMFGTRRKEDVVSATPILSKLETLYQKESPRFPVDFYFTAINDEPVSLSAKSGEKSVFCQSDFIPREAINKPLDDASVKEQLLKTGGTQFYIENVECEIENRLNVPVSVINKLRRDTLTELEQNIIGSHTKAFAPNDFNIPSHKSQSPKIICRFKNEESIPNDLTGVSEIILPLNNIKSRFDATAQLPRGIFGNSQKIYNKLVELKSKGVTSAFADTLDGIEIAKKAGLTVTAGYGTNIFNSVSLEAYKTLGVNNALLSPELTLNQIKNLGSELPRGIFAYGKLPLMLTRNCPVKNVKSCGECKQTGTITDRKNTVFTIDCSSGMSEILNSRPVYMADRLNEIKNTDFILLYFTDESKQQAQNIIKQYLSGGKPQGEFTRGLLYRGVE